MTPRRGALALVTAVLLAGCAGPSPRPPAASPSGSDAAGILRAVRSVMTGLASYTFTFTERTVSAEATTAVTGRGEVGGSKQLYATFSTGGGSISVLETGTATFAKLGPAPWQRDPSLAVHPVRWASLINGIGRARAFPAPNGGHVVRGVLTPAAVAGLGLSLGGHGAKGAGAVPVDLVMHLDAADRVTAFTATLNAAPPGAAVGPSASTLGVRSQTVTLDLSEFNAAPAVPSAPPRG